MSAAETTPGWNPIQRVILPSTDQTDTVPLYVDAGTASGIRLRENDEFARTPKLLEDKLQMFSSEQPGRRTSRTSSRRHSMRVRSGEQLSFGTYFNAFPASYWRRWTSVRDVRLVVETSGTGNRHGLQVERPRIGPARRRQARRRRRHLDVRALAQALRRRRLVLV